MNEYSAVYLLDGLMVSTASHCTPQSSSWDCGKVICSSKPPLPGVRGL